MKYNKVIIAVIVIMVFFLPVIALAQASYGRVTGNVKDEDGNPIAGVAVSTRGSSKITDENGDFKMPHLEPGVHVFSFSKNGFEPKMKRQEVLQGLNNPKINIVLKRTDLSPKQLAAKKFQEANELMRNRQFDDALATFKEAMELDPEENAYKANSGMCLYFMGKYSEALEYLEPASQAYADNPMVLTLTANSYFYARKFTEAQKMYETLGRIQSLDAAGNLNLGICYHETDQLDKALETLELASTQEPDNVDIYQRKAAVLVEQENYADAMIALEKIYEIQGASMDAKVRNTLITMLDETAKDLLEAGKPDEAMPYLEKIVKISPNSEKAKEAQKVIDTAKELERQ